MIKFGPAILEWCGSYKWRVHEPMAYEIEGVAYAVPAGFSTNMASIPRIFWNILPPTGKYAKAAILHDWLYTVGKLPRKECDQILLDGMKSLTVESWKRHLMYYSVRLFGKSHYG
jgi:hypothetical protein